MMARPIRALELHYPMIQFLIKKDILHSSNTKIDRKGPRYIEHTFFLSLGPSLYGGTIVLCSMRNCGQWRYVLQCFVKWPKLWVHIYADRLFSVALLDVSYDLLVKFTKKFFFIIGSVLHLKYHNEGKRKITDAFQSIYLSGNFPEKWHPVHRFISLHSLQWYRVPTIQPPHPSHHTLKNKEFYLSFTLMFTKYWLSQLFNKLSFKN